MKFLTVNISHRAAILSLLLALSLLNSDAAAQTDYRFVLDKNYSSIMGAEDLVTIHRGWYQFEDSQIPIKPFDEETVLGKSGGIGYRLLKTVTIDLFVDAVIGLVQHEYFGHGWRLREFGDDNVSYSFRLHPPFSYSATTYPGSKLSLSFDQSTIISIAGSQANTVISEKLRESILTRGSINYREAMPYLAASNDLTLYILSTSEDNYEPGNDVIHYLGSVTLRNPSVTLSGIQHQVKVNFLNPMMIYSAYAYFIKYLIFGEPTTSIPRIKILEGNYLPSLRMGLTPYGYEYRIDNLYYTPSQLINAYFGFGSADNSTSLRVGCSAKELLSVGNLHIGGSVEGWHQPSLRVDGVTHDNDLGIKALCDLRYYFTSSASSGNIVLQLGYKSSGFTETDAIVQGPIVRAGVGFSN